MTIISRTMYPVQTSINLITKMQDRFEKLQTQMSTGQKANSLAELGSDRYVDLSIRARMSRIEGYQANVEMVNVRLDLIDNVVEGLDKVESDARVALKAGSYGGGNVNFASVPSLSEARLDQVVTLMNMDADGRYLFGGSETGKRPLLEPAELIEGGGGKAGFRQVASERRAADVGDGLGRLTLTSATDTVTLSEDGTHPFGFKIGSVNASNLASATPTTTAGPPKSVAVQFTTQPTPGDNVSYALTLPDGTSETITLKATAGTPEPGEFQIGIDVDATAANLKTTLQTSLTTMGKAALVAASSYAAADNFFNANGDPVLRVQGVPFSTATVLAVADPTTTLTWYSGSSATDPRSTVQSKVDEASTVNYGVQANENGPTQLVRTLAVLAIQVFDVNDSAAPAKYDAVAKRNADRLSEQHNNEEGSIELLSIELGTVKDKVSTISDRNGAYAEQLGGMLDHLESVSDEQVAMELLALRTRLQATYQATSIITQLSLVNYIK